MTAIPTHFTGRLHIAGSASRDCDPGLLVHAHEAVHALVRTVLAHGGSLVVTAVGEPRSADGSSGVPLVFDWTALDAAYTSLSAGEAHPLTARGPLVVAVTSERANAAMPAERHAAWRGLLTADALDLRQLPPGWGAGGELRNETARHGDALITIAGGEGVEHLVSLYQRRKRPVIPLDYPLGSATPTSAGGGREVARAARATADNFLSLRGPGSAAARLARLAHHLHPSGSDLADEIVLLLDELAPPPAFYVRVLDPANSAFPMVEEHFEQVVTPVVESLGYQPIQIGAVPSRSPFINVDIFDRLSTATVAVVDLTGLRANCFLELGYALGATIPTIITAQARTQLPFDSQAMPCWFWDPATSAEERCAKLYAFWQTHIGRRSLHL